MGKDTIVKQRRQKKNTLMAGNWPTTEDEFVNAWFWEGQNGNNLVKRLNQVSGVTDRIRREKFAPHIYGIVLNDDQFPFRDDEDVQWKLCKIGFTHKDTTPGENNRMKQLVREIQSKYTKTNKREATAEILFVVQIGAVDSTPYNLTEERIRKKVGKPVHKEVAKKYGLVCSTEWVLTTQDYIDRIMGMKKKKNDSIKEKREGDLIDIFKDLKENAVPNPSKSYEDEWLHAPAETSKK